MKTSLGLFLLVIVLYSCKDSPKPEAVYEDQIGDTYFNKNLDDPKFKFCDSTNVLHKRAYVRYTGGTKALEEELLKNFVFKPEYESFSGYFIIRFAVNCNDMAGRYRIEVLDLEFNLASYPENLKQHIELIFKRLQNWNHPTYQEKHYDGYTFYCLRIDDGKILKS